MSEYDEQHRWEEAGDAELLPPEEEGGASRWVIVLALVVASVLVGFIVLDGMESQTYFYSVDQAVAQGDDLVGETVRVKGTVEAGSIQGTSTDLERVFRIAEKGKAMTIAYDRALPDTFQEGVEVVATGEVDETMTLHADEILVKCPSRYEGEAPDAMGTKPQAAR